MRRLASLLTLSFLLLVPTLVQADQTDPRLNGLFERLRSAEDRRSASPIERRIWQAWLATEDDDVRLLMRQGLAAMRAGNMDTALRSFDTAIAAAPDFAEAWNKRATVHFMRGDYPASVRDIAEVLAREPRHFGALSGLGMIYLRIGEDAAALKSFTAALAINPHLTGGQAHVEMLEKRLSGLPT